MDISWDINKKQQIINFKFCARQIHTGFYQELRFYVLPFLPKKFRDRVIYFPAIESFIKYFKLRKHFNRGSYIPSNIECEIQKTVDILLSKNKKNILKNKTLFQSIQNKFIKHLEVVFPKLKEYKIIISPSMVGSVGYYDYKGNNMLIYPRFDRNTTTICQLIITAATHFFQYPKTIGQYDIHMLEDNSWFEKQKKANDISQKNIFSELNKEIIY